MGAIRRPLTISPTIVFAGATAIAGGGGGGGGGGGATRKVTSCCGGSTSVNISGIKTSIARPITCTINDNIPVNRRCRLCQLAGSNRQSTNIGRGKGMTFALVLFPYRDGSGFGHLTSRSTSSTAVFIICLPVVAPDEANADNSEPDPLWTHATPQPVSVLTAIGDLHHRF